MDVVNLERLDDSTGGDPGFAAGLLAEFASMIPSQAEELLQFIEARDCVRGRAAAHSIKGAAATLGVERIAFAAAQLEIACRDADVEACDRGAPLLEAALESFFAWYEAYSRAKSA
jgi:HPt (histidine-containing phosphotransfer) domain-containing protein